MVSKQKRRTFLKGLGASGTAAITLSTAATATKKDDENTTITVADDPANSALIERARELDYQRATLGTTRTTNTESRFCRSSYLWR